MKQLLRNTWAALSLACLIASCGPPPKAPEQMLAKSWRLKTLNIKNQPPPPPDVMGNSSFNFNPNGRYEIQFGELERGTWRLSDDKKVLITVPDGSPMQQEIDVSNLTDSTLTLTNNGGATPVEMNLVPL